MNKPKLTDEDIKEILRKAANREKELSDFEKLLNLKREELGLRRRE